MDEQQAKTEFNARAKASMRAYLESKSWAEKIRSIERMNATQKLAQEAMRIALEKRKASRIGLTFEKPGDPKNDTKLD